MTDIRILLVFGLIFTVSAQAATDCDSLQGTAEMSECNGIEFKKADDELNAVYGKLLKILDSEGKSRLKESQRAWLNYRDSNANFRADINRGGNWEPIRGTEAKTEMTMQRAKELKNELELRK